jgi:hypothetical protein
MVRPNTSSQGASQMATRRGIPRTVRLACFLLLALGLALVQPAWSARNDVGMFYEALASYGTWIDYGNYGPVWYPNKVSSTWRPYLDGRWVPSHSGWVFETSEPWGWATYHYGNWMPTTEYGWVWSPGSTWYPSTAAWRTSDDYIGWAPTPPPDYVPEPAFYPTGGYNSEAPALDQLAAPLWIFARAAEFLLGFGQPYSPDYSYYNSFDTLAPFSYAPIVYGGTFPLTDFYYPSYAPAAYFCFGPPFPYVCRVGHRNLAEFNTFVGGVNYSRMRNVLPPARVARQFPSIRDAVPSALSEGRGFGITRVADAHRAERALNRPGVIPPPANLPAFAKSIPKVSPAQGTKDLADIKGMALPRQAQRPLTNTMRRQINLQHQMGPPRRIETRPEFRPLGKAPAAPRLPEVMPAPGRAAKPAPRLTTTGITRAAPPREIHPPAAGGYQPAPSRAFRAPAPEVGRAAPVQKFHMPSGFRPAVPREFRAAPAPAFHAAPRPEPPRTYRAPAPRAVSPAPGGPAPARTGAPPSHKR